jgi:hypothetical protein
MVMQSGTSNGRSSGTSSGAQGGMPGHLRPMWLDYQVFLRVVIQLQAIEEVARWVCMEPEQIVRWVDQITEYLLHRPGADDQAAQEKRLADEIYSEQLEWLAQKSMVAFAQSTGEWTVWRVANGKQSSKTIRSAGDSRYINTYERLVVKRRALPQSRLKAAFVNTLIPAGVNFHTFAAAAVHLSPAEAAEIRKRNESRQQDAAEREAAIQLQKEKQRAQDEADDRRVAEEEVLENAQKMAELYENTSKGSCSADVSEQEDEDDEEDEYDVISLEELDAYITHKKAEWAAEQTAQQPVQPVQGEDPGGDAKALTDPQKSARKKFLSGS